LAFLRTGVAGGNTGGSVIKARKVRHLRIKGHLMKRRPLQNLRDFEIINRHADELNREAMDALTYQVPLWDDESSTRNLLRPEP